MSAIPALQEHVVETASVPGCAEPPFRLVCAGGGEWALSGEVDSSAASLFGAALDAAMREDEAVLDLSGLLFIDVAGMRTLAVALAHGGSWFSVRGVSASLRRYWTLGRFDHIAPLVELRQLA